MTTDGRIAGSAPMAGDPGMPEVTTSFGRDACLYAAAMLAKRGTLTGDLGRFDAHHDGNATVVFIAADGTQAEAARFTIPPRVLAFNPYAPPKRLTDQRGTPAGEPSGRTE